MERGKDLSGFYLFVGALTGFFIGFAIAQVFFRPLIAAHYGPIPPHSKPPIAQTYAESRVEIISSCVGSAIGMFAGVKIYSIRQRRRESAKP